MAEKRKGLRYLLGVDASGAHRDLEGLNKTISEIDAAAQAAGGTVRGALLEGVADGAREAVAAAKAADKALRSLGVKSERDARKQIKAQEDKIEAIREAAKIGVISARELAQAEEKHRRNIERINRSIGRDGSNAWERLRRAGSTALRALRGGLGNARRDAGRLASGVDRIARGLRQVASLGGRAAGALGRASLRGAGIAARGVGAAGAAGVAGAGGLAALVRGQAGEIRELELAARGAGVEVKKFAELEFVFRRFGLEVRDTTEIFQTLNERIAQAAAGDENVLEALKLFGILPKHLRDSKGQLISADRLFLKIADRSGKIADGAEKTQASIRLLGEQGARQALPVLQSGRKEIERLVKEGRDLGTLIDDEDVERARELDMSIRQIFDALKGIARGVARELFGGMTNSAERLGDLLAQNQQAIVQGIVGALRTARATLSELVLGVRWLGVAFRSAVHQATELASGVLGRGGGLLQRLISGQPLFRASDLVPGILGLGRQINRLGRQAERQLDILTLKARRLMKQFELGFLKGSAGLGSGPFDAMATRIGSAVGGIVPELRELNQTFRELKDMAVSAGQEIGDVWERVKPLLLDALSVLEQVRNWVSPFVEAFSDLSGIDKVKVVAGLFVARWLGAFKAVGAGLSWLRGKFSGLISRGAGALGDLAARAGGAAIGAGARGTAAGGRAALGVGRAAANAGAVAAGALGSSLKDGIMRALYALKPLIIRALAAIGISIGGAVDFWPAIIIGALAAVLVAVVAYWDDIKAAVGTAADWIAEKGGKAWDWIAEKGAELGSALGTVWSRVAAEAGNAWDAARAAGASAWSGVQAAWNAAPGFFGSVWSRIRSGADSLWGALRSGASSTLDTLRSWASSVGDLLSDLWGSIRSAGSAVASSARGAFSRVRRAVGFATGGPVHGPGGPTDDRVLARLSAGEFVVRAAAVRRYGLEVLHAINAGRLQLPGYAAGGLVMPTPSVSATPNIRIDGHAGSSGRPLYLDIPGIGPVATRVGPRTADTLERKLARKSRARAANLPAWA